MIGSVSVGLVCLPGDQVPPQAGHGDDGHDVRRRCRVGYFIMRIDFLSSLQGEQTVRTLPKTNQMLQRLLKSMPKPSRRYVHESIPTKLRVKS